MMNDDHDEQDTTAVEMKFCSECNNMLYPRENKVLKQLEFFCRRCNYKETSTDYIVYRNDIKSSHEYVLTQHCPSACV
jgi:DNA-directed RNA polymerase II subunit RPB9